MRSRTLREGSVGLLIIFSILLFAGVALWIRGIKFGENSYEIVADFPDVNGIQVGDGVRYRGLKVGRIIDIRPGTNGVDVQIEIASSKLLIPKNVTITTRSSGLIGETFIDIVPETELSSKTLDMSPIAKSCDSKQIICNNARLRGERGITLDDLLPLTYRFSKAYGDPEFVAKIDATVENSSVAAAEVANLSRDTAVLVKQLQQEVSNISTVSKTVTDVANNTSTEVIATAEKYQNTAEQVSRLATSVEELVNQNKTNLTVTLDSIGTTSDRLQGLVVKLDKTVDAADTQKLAANLQTLTTNATVASQNLKDISANFSNPDSLVNLQQTLDSARVTFDNAQKITSDLESITGDPAFLENVRTLVNGLSNLVSSTEQLEQQVQTRQELEPVQQALSFQSLPSIDSRFIDRNLNKQLTIND
jgi:phospholipid/cholesterol/gamma-HCH transport system substrate-binding protein